MAGVTNFPASVDDFSTQSPATLGTADALGRTHSERHDDVEAAMESVQASLVSGMGLRNLLRNGCFRVAQRGTVTPTYPAACNLFFDSGVSSSAYVQADAEL